MFVAFAKGIGNFGRDVEGRMFVPDKAIAKFSGTGNYVFRSLEDAQEFKTKNGSYVAIFPVEELTRIIQTTKDQRKTLLERGYVQDTAFRLRKGEDVYTLGVVFHERSPSATENSTTSDVKVLLSEPAFSVVLKRENMLGKRLDPINRIPWGKASGIVHCGATARSMPTILATVNLAQRFKN